MLTRGKHEALHLSQPQEDSPSQSTWLKELQNKWGSLHSFFFKLGFSTHAPRQKFHEHLTKEKSFVRKFEMC